MAGIFRFSNAVSDIRKFIDTYKVIFEKLRDQFDFTHDNGVKVLIDNGLASSRLNSLSSSASYNLKKLSSPSTFFDFATFKSHYTSLKRFSL